MPRVFLIHGWEGRPNNHWFPWLALELKARGWEVNAPHMPPGTRMDPSSTAELTTGHGADNERGYTLIPKVSEWLDFLKGYVGKPDKDTYFVGHSLGCITIARYLAGIHGTDTDKEHGSSAEHTPPQSSPLKRGGGKKVGGCVFVAGFSGRLNIPEIREFYELPFDPEQAKKHCNKFVMIFSDNDSYVPVAKSLEFAKQLGAKTILERGKGHFTAGDGVTALPSVLSALLKVSQA